MYSGGIVKQKLESFMAYNNYPGREFHTSRLKYQREQTAYYSYNSL